MEGENTVNKLVSWPSEYQPKNELIHLVSSVLHFDIQSIFSSISQSMKIKIAGCSSGARKKILKQEEDTSLDLEDNIVIEILFRLPVKSLAQFKCVSNKWNQFISYDSYFRKNYTTVGGTPLMLGFFHNALLLCETKSQPGFTPSTDEAKRMLDALDDNDKDNLTTTCPWSGVLDGSLSFVGGDGHDELYLQLLATSNGYLLCCSQRDEIPYDSHYFICNPVTKEWLSLPIPKYASDEFMVIAAFSCNESFSDYKVVRIICPDDVYSTTLTIEIFHPKSHKGWKELIATAPTAFQFHDFESGVIIEKSGLVYWLAEGNDTRSSVVIVFDEHSSQLEIISLPMGLAEDNIDGQHRLGQANGRVVYALNLDTTHAINLWVMDEDQRTWSTHLHCNVENLNMIDAIHPLDHRRLLILLGKGKRKAVWLNIETKEMEVVHDNKYFIEGFNKTNTHSTLYRVPYIWSSWPPSFSLYK